MNYIWAELDLNSTCVIVTMYIDSERKSWIEFNDTQLTGLIATLTEKQTELRLKQ